MQWGPRYQVRPFIIDGSMHNGSFLPLRILVAPVITFIPPGIFGQWDSVSLSMLLDILAEDAGRL